MHVGIIHVLLHRLVWAVGNQFSCLWWQLSFQTAVGSGACDVVVGNPIGARWQN